ncbi:hypothetical protein VT03_00465 [Planctomyces sp. SH-PL14]|nr:hypothetical protein VT03_00465 [Planctomyces sp. SH-PL14]
MAVPESSPERNLSGSVISLATEVGNFGVGACMMHEGLTQSLEVCATTSGGWVFLLLGGLLAQSPSPVGAFADWWSPDTGHRGPGAPWWGVQRGNAPLPAGGLAVDNCLKE